MNRTVRIALAAIAFLGTPTIARAQSGADRFQQALKKERVDGDLKGAIALYQQILKDQEADRSLSAKVLLQLGSAYEKQGSTDAKAAYQRIVRDYSDQADAASAARARLATLSPAAVANGGPTVRRIWSGSDVDLGGAPTRDARLLTFVDWQTGDLAVRDLATGQNRHLTNKGTWTTSPEFALFSVPSPDGRHVAYTWFNAKAETELRIIGMDGGTPRVLFSNPEVQYVQPSDWSPDGKLIVALLARTDHSTQIAVISTVDGSVRVLKTLDWRGPGQMSFSPDGKYIVYDAPPNDSTSKRDVYALASDGRSESVLVKNPADDQAMGWSPDGRYVLFSSDRTGYLSFWIVRVDNGKSANEPVLVRRDAELSATPMGITSDGTLMFGANRSFPEMLVADIDAMTGALKGQPTRLVDNFVGMNLGVEWSPDGSELAYVRQPPGARTTRLLIVRSMATGIEHVVPVKLNYLQVPRWTPDGRGLVMRARDLKGRDGYYLIDRATGESTVLLEGALQNTSAGWADGGKSFIYSLQDIASRTFAIISKDIASGDTTDVFRFTVDAGKALNAFALSQVEVSPDGRSVAFVLRTDTSRSALRIMSTGGGESRELFRSPVGKEINAVTWSPDGRHVYFTQRPDLSAPSNTARIPILRISIAGGVAEETGIAAELISRMRVHPDGKRIAFMGGVASPGEVWVMENFLPKAEEANKRSR